jgi:hypothetical protein
MTFLKITKSGKNPGPNLKTLLQILLKKIIAKVIVTKHFAHVFIIKYV